MKDSLCQIAATVLISGLAADLSNIEGNSTSRVMLEGPEDDKVLAIINEGIVARFYLDRGDDLELLADWYMAGRLEEEGELLPVEIDELEEYLDSLKELYRMVIS